ncbi:MAG: 4Fe-4S binding protein [Anaerobiospirillum sp.]|nr:4Fe-4S binding protein [Anaerobiospirillum sp.]
MFVIDPDTCTACDSCMDACPCDAISVVDGVHTIDPDLCVDCGACMDVCEFGSIFEVDEADIIPKKDV